MGSVDAIYDRAALVALPDAMRRRYAKHLMGITQKVPQLLRPLNTTRPAARWPALISYIRELYAESYTL